MNEPANRTLEIHLEDQRKQFLQLILDARNTEHAWGILGSPMSVPAFTHLGGKLEAFNQMTEIVKGMRK